MASYGKWFVAALISAAGAACFAAEPAASEKGAAKQQAAEQKAAEPKLAVGDQAPDFVIQDADGKKIKLAELTAKGPVLVRLTCGCSGCDKELAYFQELHKAYGEKGLTSLAVFKEPDQKVADYVKQKKLNMLYAVDTKGGSWDIFKTKTMPTNFLIDKGGRIVSIASGCDPSGLLANKLADKVAGLVGSDKVDVQKEVAKQAVDKPAKAGAK
ncbi:MAG TPA: redoxin domain-containing protein [Pirellulales bacterium]|nr:redoxin domain-containing protein [Pirellulales bacterium]